MRRTTSLVAFAVLGACTSLDGLSGPGEVVDAGTTADAAVDFTGEAGAPEDAGFLDDAADAAADRCVVAGLRTRICDEFERTQSVIRQAQAPEDWNAAGAATLVTDDVRTSTVASFSAGGSDAAPTQSYLTKELGDVRRFVYRARVRTLVAPTGSSARQIVTVRWEGINSAYVHLFLGSSGSLFVQEYIPGTGSTNHPSSVGIAPSGWHDIELEADLSTYKVRLTVDGVSGLPAGETFPRLPSFPANAQVQLTTGAVYSDLTLPCTVRLDDVVIATP